MVHDGDNNITAGNRYNGQLLRVNILISTSVLVDQYYSSTGLVHLGTQISESGVTN